MKKDFNLLTLNQKWQHLDCGTCNFGGDDVFVNTENTIKEFGTKDD